MLMDTVVSQIAKVDSVAVMNLKEGVAMANALVTDMLLESIVTDARPVVAWMVLRLEVSTVSK